MEYEMQWFPTGRTKYDIDKLLKAAAAQKELKNVKKVTAVNRYQDNKPPIRPEAVQFTVPGSYPYEALDHINKKLTPKSKSAEPQILSIRAVGFEERKKKSTKLKSKRKITKCGCKK